MKNLKAQKETANSSRMQRPATWNGLFAICLLATTMLLSSCEAIGDIFKAGMGVGIFLVLAVVILIVVIVMRVGKK